MPPITLAGFEARFARDADPWGTRERRDERIKREAIYRALRAGRRGRVLEVASGNGSNSGGLARRSLRLVAIDGAPSACALTRDVLTRNVLKALRAEVVEMALPQVPGGVFDAAVVAEVLYYLRPRDVVATGRALAGAVRRGGVVVLAHHAVEFDDVSSSAVRCHDRLVAGLESGGRTVTREVVARTRAWRVERVGL